MFLLDLPSLLYFIYLFLDAPDIYGSVSGSLSISLLSSDAYTTSSSYMENSMPIIISSVKTNSFNSSQSTTSVFVVQTSPSDFNKPFTSPSTIAITNNLVTSDIEPSFTSMSAIINSNLNSYNSFSSFSEDLSNTSTLLLPSPPSTGMLAPITFSNNSSINRWRCNKDDDNGNDSGQYIFPAIEMEDLRFSLWQDTLQGVSYLYHVNSSEIGCSGTVTEIRFCYRVSLNVYTEEHIFNMSIMNNSRHLVNFLEIYSTPTNSSGNSTIKNCLNWVNNNTKYCCDSMNLKDDNITFPASEFILGIEASNSSQARLQNFRHNVSKGVYNIPAEINNMKNVATTFPVIRFIIRTLKRIK